MDILYVVLFVLIIYLLITNKSSYNEKIDALERRIIDLQHLIKQIPDIDALERRIIDLQHLIKQIPDGKSVPVTPKPFNEPIAKPIIVADDIKEKQSIPEEPKPWLPENIEHHKEVITDPLSTIRRPLRTSSTSPTPAFKPSEPELSFFERYPDLEKFIGENLINKIGIAILVLAIGFFVKYAIDNNWIGPVGRVGIGVLCAGILIGIAHKLRNSYKAFSSVLVGGGLAVLYFTITLAYHQFHLFNQTTSFIILIVITSFAVVLSLLYDKQELAIIALIGGLSSPFIVSGDHANYHALFIYLIILNAGLLVIAYNKSWRILNAAAFALTVIVFSVVLFTLTAPTYFTGFIYASILYLLFFSINVANNVRENKKFVASDFTILLTNTALYFAVGLYLFTVMHMEQWRGLFSASLGVINLALSYLLFKNKKVDTNILYLLIGITLTFISLTAPIQLHGHNITLFWAAETVLLYWLYQKSNIKLMKLTSLIIWGAMITSLWIDWINIYSDTTKTIAIIANKGFITTFFTALSSYLLSVLMGKDESEEIYNININARVFKYSAFLLLFLTGLLEINHQFLNHYPGIELNSLYLMLYVPAFIYIFHILSKRVAGIQLSWMVSTALLSICIVTYFLFTPQFFNVQYYMLTQNKISTMHFIAHWWGVVFVALLFYQLILIAKNQIPEEFQKAATWIIAGGIVLFLSLEICLAANLIFYSKTNLIEGIQTVYIKVGLPILWGLASFALMWLGMRNKVSTLRIISLTLFSITLFKLFAFDIQNIPPAGKIAAFFCLGVLLLIVSFMYQKVKKIIVEDETIKHP